MGTKSRAFNWMRDFLNNRSIQVKIGTVKSNKYIVKNGTLRGSVINPLLFLVMINDIFDDIPVNIGSSLLAGDGALWKRKKVSRPRLLESTCSNPYTNLHTSGSNRGNATES